MRKALHRLVLAFLAAQLPASGAYAGGATTATDLPAWAQQTQAVPRRALLLGVSTYAHATQLSTPPYDVNEMHATLNKLHFDSVDVVGPAKVSRGDILNAVKAFAAELKPGDLALIYYSGHGVQVDGINYLVPSEGEANPDAPGMAWVSVSYVMNTIAAAQPGATVILLDACRANPFVGTGAESRDVLGSAPMAPPASHGPEANSGLAPAGGPNGRFLVAFAAQPLMAAYSRFDNDPPTVESIYTRTLSPNLIARSPVERALANTETQVLAATRNQQDPMNSSSSLWDLPLDETLPESPIVMEDWRYTATYLPAAGQVRALQDFIADHPLSAYTPTARSYLAQLSPVSPQWDTPDGAKNSSPASSNLIFGALQGGRTGPAGDTAVATTSTMLRASPGGGRSLGSLLAGVRVKILNYTSKAAQIVTPGGQVGWVRNVFQLDPSRFIVNVALGFDGTDEYAAVSDWQPLVDATARYTSKSSALTIRTGLSGESDLAHARLVGRLRALRIREYAIQLGVAPERIFLIPNDPTVSHDQARIAVLKVSQ